jgi:hypothetical protein
MPLSGSSPHPTPCVALQLSPHPAPATQAAVQRDPQGLEGIELDCDRTNAKLRAVYEHYIEQGQELQSPSGAFYEAQAALDAVDELCGDGGGADAVMRAQSASLRKEEKLNKKVRSAGMASPNGRFRYGLMAGAFPSPV